MKVSFIKKIKVSFSACVQKVSTLEQNPTANVSFPYTELLLWGSKERPGLGSQLLGTEGERSPSIAPQGGSQLLPLSSKAVPQPALALFRCAQYVVCAQPAVFTFKRKRSNSPTGGAHTSEILSAWRVVPIIFC